jgi:hypothetical protein
MTLKCEPSNQFFNGYIVDVESKMPWAKQLQSLRCPPSFVQSSHADDGHGPSRGHVSPSSKRLTSVCIHQNDQIRTRSHHAVLAPADVLLVLNPNAALPSLKLVRTCQVVIEVTKGVRLAALPLYVGDAATE